MNRKEIGYWGENQAKLFLEKKGFQILHQNWKAGRGGELDIVGLHQAYLVFVEVKTRHEPTFLPAELTIGLKQQKKLIQMAVLYLKYFPVYTQDVRFDSLGIAILSPEEIKITHIEEAFYSW